MILRSLLSVAGTLLLTAGEALPDIQPYASLGAAGILTAILIIVLRDAAKAREERIQERREERTVLTTIHDRLHADSEKLNETLRAMTAHCAQKQAEHKGRVLPP